MATLIKSVLGFNLNLEIKDQTGQPIKVGARTIYPDEILSHLNYKLLDAKFFTNYNQALIDKIRDMRRNID
jgi:hypothetical protein